MTLTGLQTLSPPEDRAMAHVEVIVNGETYNWQVYVPADKLSNMDQYFAEIEPSVVDDILKKEAEWQALDPKTKELHDPLGETIVVDIEKSEIVKPTIPDYYAMRRAEYPSIGDQLDALWKGVNSVEFQAVLDQIQQIKDKYPKSVD